MSRLLSDIVKKLDLSLGFLWFLCQMEQEAEKQELATSGRAVPEPALPRARCVGRSRSEGGWNSVASTGVQRGWRMLGEEGSPAKMVLFILQQKSDTWKDGIF